MRVVVVGAMVVVAVVVVEGSTRSSLRRRCHESRSCRSIYLQSSRERTSLPELSVVESCQEEHGSSTLATHRARHSADGVLQSREPTPPNIVAGYKE